MSDDIETLRGFINGQHDFDNEAVKALGRLGADRDSLRAKLEKAKAWIDGTCCQCDDECDEAKRMGFSSPRKMCLNYRARAVLSELSADAPAQQTQISNGPEVTKPEGLGSD